MNENKFMKQSAKIDAKGRIIYSNINIVDEKFKDIINNLNFISEGIRYKRDKQDNGADSMLIKKEIELLEIQLQVERLYSHLKGMEY